MYRRTSYKILAGEVLESNEECNWKRKFLVERTGLPDKSNFRIINLSSTPVCPNKKFIFQLHSHTALSFSF